MTRPKPDAFGIALSEANSDEPVAEDLKCLKIGDNIDSRLVLAVKPVSDHPGDSYLQQVLCWYVDKYVVWRYNAQDCGFFCGRYCGEDFEKAAKIYIGQENEQE